MKAWMPPAAVLLAAVLCLASYLLGRDDGRALCEGKQAVGQVTAEVAVKDTARKDIARSAKTGAAREEDRVALNDLFDRLSEEARHDTPDPVDSCVLPPDRLRRWADANAGITDQGAAASEPDGGASAAATTGFWARARLGGQPPPGGPRLSPVGEPDVSASGVSGSGP